MSYDHLETLIRMANQIADNNGAYEAGEAAERVASHIKRFWAKKMKQDIIDYLNADGTELNPVAKHSVEILSGAYA